MEDDGLRGRITDQFSYRGERSDVWRVFDRLFPTNAFLNLGYAPWYVPYPVASSQPRLARHIGRRVAARLPMTSDRRLLDVGCGRGGPTLELADRFGFRVTGIDLVPYNVARARENAAERGASAEFLIADATRLPLRPGAMDACTAIDSVVYFPDRAAAFAEIAEALAPHGVFVLADLMARGELSSTERDRVDAFADAWDMPSLGTVDRYRDAMAATGLAVQQVADVTPNSVGRFRRWTTSFLALADGPLGPAVDRALRASDLDPDAVTEQIRIAHVALPSLRHVVVVAEPSA